MRTVAGNLKSLIFKCQGTLIKKNIFCRNEFLAKQGFPAPKAVKTGTTIAGFVYKDGVILGADTRATEGNIVADKNCFKLHYMAPNI